MLPTVLDLFFQLFYLCPELNSGKFHNLAYGTKRFAPPTSCDKSEHVPGLRRSAYSHHQMASYLNLPFLQDLQERGLGRNY